MMTLKIYAGFGHDCEFKSRDHMFYPVEIISKVEKSRAGFSDSLSTPAEKWAQYIRTVSAFNVCLNLMDRYGVKNFNVFCTAPIAGWTPDSHPVAHGEFIQDYFKLNMGSRVRVVIELDKEGRNWQPPKADPLPLISHRISPALLLLAPGEDNDDKTLWMNEALRTAVSNRIWESTPSVMIYKDEQPLLDEFAAQLSDKCDSQKITTLEDLKNALKLRWVELECPEIFK